MSSSTPSRSQQPFPPASTSSPAFPQHSHLHQRTLTSSSASSSNFPPNSGAPQAPAVALTVDALLATHAGTQDPKLAALEQATAERNTLSSQNGQLWKLIEKQRAGYNQILKELERVRSEARQLQGKAFCPYRRPKETPPAEPIRKSPPTDDNIPTPALDLSRLDSRTSQPFRLFRATPPPHPRAKNRPSPRSSSLRE
ncbi:hypothetical protein B0H11DRAFT_1926596 [Mycena galericulata]|nr:hypothetical protein B0H11DRAFT_1926596 [Mycena galericulata]